MVFSHHFILCYIYLKVEPLSWLLFLLQFTFQQNAYLFHFSNLSGIFLHLAYFYFALAKLFLSEQKWNLSITFVLFYSPNTQFLTHICLFTLEIKWNLFITCSALPNMNLSGTCSSLGSKLTWISLNKLFYF